VAIHLGLRARERLATLTLSGTGGQTARRIRRTARQDDTMESDDLTTAVATLSENQRETNTRLDRIEQTLETSSRLFELMHERLEHIEDGQKALVEGQKALVEGQKVLVEGQGELVVGQKAVIERLDHLVEATIRERTLMIERLAEMDERVRRLEDHVFGPEDAPQ
jgi:hypothetical protein